MQTDVILGHKRPILKGLLGFKMATVKPKNLFEALKRFQFPLPKNVGDLGKIIVAKGFKKLPKVQKLPNLVTLMLTQLITVMEDKVWAQASGLWPQRIMTSPFGKLFATGFDNKWPVLIAILI